jgi:hypothetical protein
MTSSMPEQTAEREQEEEWEKQDVPAADNEDDSSEHESPERKAHRGLAIVGVPLAATGLGEAAADHVSDAQDRGVQPYLVGAKYVVSIASRLGDRSGDEQPDQNGDVREEFGGLE